jgi:hypothetical protein
MSGIPPQSEPKLRLASKNGRQELTIEIWETGLGLCWRNGEEVLTLTFEDLKRILTNVHSPVAPVSHPR